MAKPLLVEIYADASQYTRTLDKAAGRTRRFGAAAKIAGGLLVTGLAIGLEKSVKAGIEAEQSQARLRQAFKNSGLSLVPYKKRIEELESAGRKLGFTDDSQRTALGSLITATGDYTKAAKDLAVAEDLARFKHVSLEDASKMLTMAMTGSQRAVKQLGITVIPLTTHLDALKAAHDADWLAAHKSEVAHAKLLDKMATGEAIIQKVTDKTKGQGKAYADTAAGGAAQLHAQTQHLEEELGKKLVPALVTVIGWVNRFLDWVERSTVKVRAWRDSMIDGLVGAFHSVEGAIKGAIQWIHGLWDWLVKITTKVWDITVHIKIPDLPVPHLKVGRHGIHFGAAGGLVTRPTLAMLGEAGPEAVVPLNRAAGASPLGVGGGTVVFNFPNYHGDKQELMQMIRREVTQLRRRGGTF